MADQDPETIEQTLLTETAPGISAKELLRRVRNAHPKASKKQIVRAAFSSLIAVAERDVEAGKRLQDFALQARGPARD